MCTRNLIVGSPTVNDLVSLFLSQIAFVCILFPALSVESLARGKEYLCVLLCTTLSRMLRAPGLLL